MFAMPVGEDHVVPGARSDEQDSTPSVGNVTSTSFGTSDALRLTPLVSGSPVAGLNRSGPSVP